MNTQLPSSPDPSSLKPREPVPSPASEIPAESADPSESQPTEPAPLALEMPVSVRSLALIVIAVCVTIYLLRAMREVLIPVALSVLVFHLLAPFVESLVRWRVPRILAATIVMLSALGATAFTAWSLKEEAVQVVNQLPEAVRTFRSTVRSWQGQGDSSLKQVKEAAAQLESTAKEAMGPDDVPRGVTRVQVVDPIVSIGNIAITGSRNLVIAGGVLVLVLVFSFFLLVSADRLKRLTVQVAGPTLTKKKITVQILDEISRQIQHFLLIQLVASIIVSAATTLALWWLGVSYAVVWGLAAGVLNSVPYVGAVVVTAALTAIALLQFGTLSMALWVGGITLAITTLESLLLTPILQGRVSQMNQVAIFIGILFWTWMWGPVGLFLAVPMTMIVKVICDHLEGFQGMGKLMSE